jgi:preprotein translocase subunit SecY
MGIEKLDPILKFVPGIKRPDKPLSFREKLKWTGIIMAVYFTMFGTPAFGVDVKALATNPILTILNTIFAARIGTLMTVGIAPIVLSSIVLQLLHGTGIINLNLEDTEQKGRFQGIQKLAAIAIAFVEAIILARGVVLISPSMYALVALQMAIGAIIVVFLDEAMVKYGITSGINLFIAGGIAFSIVAGTANILIPEAAAAIASGQAAALSNAIMAFGPLFFTVVIFLISIYVLDMKIELPLVFSQFRGVGGRLPIPFLYISVLPVILATSLTVSLSVWFRPLAGVHGVGANIVHFLAYYTNQTTATTSGPTLSGGLIYFMQPLGMLPYNAPYGVGGYGNYFYLIATQTAPLFPPWGGAPLMIPEWVHFIIYTVILVILCIIFGKFWVEMAGMSPKNVAEQLQDVGWQIPGFRRDPRTIEGILNKYLPTITVLGSIFVGLLAAFATITGAIGNGMGILLTAGIMYGVYQQLEQEHMIESYPALGKILD